MVYHFILYMTKRKDIINKLTGSEADVRQISKYFSLEEDQVFEEMRHIKKSLDNTDKKLLVKPPKCHNCGFDNFKDILSDPSKCPNCNNENLSKIIFKIVKT